MIYAKEKQPQVFRLPLFFCAYLPLFQYISPALSVSLCSSAHRRNAIKSLSNLKMFPNEFYRD